MHITLSGDKTGETISSIDESAVFVYDGFQRFWRQLQANNRNNIGGFIYTATNTRYKSIWFESEVVCVEVSTIFNGLVITRTDKETHAEIVFKLKIDETTTARVLSLSVDVRGELDIPIVYLNMLEQTLSILKLLQPQEI